MVLAGDAVPSFADDEDAKPMAGPLVEAIRAALRDYAELLCADGRGARLRPSTASARRWTRSSGRASGCGRSPEAWPKALSPASYSAPAYPKVRDAMNGKLKAALAVDRPDTL